MDQRWYFSVHALWPMNFDLWTIRATHNAWQRSQDKFDKKCFQNHSTHCAVRCSMYVALPFNPFCKTIRSTLQNRSIHIAKPFDPHCKPFDLHCKTIRSDLQNHSIPCCKPIRSELQNHSIHVQNYLIHIQNHSICIAKPFDLSYKAIQSML